MEVIFRDKKNWAVCNIADVPPRFLRHETHCDNCGGSRSYQPFPAVYLNASPLTMIDGNTMFHCGGMCS